MSLFYLYAWTSPIASLKAPPQKFDLPSTFCMVPSNLDLWGNLELSQLAFKHPFHHFLMSEGFISLTAKSEFSEIFFSDLFFLADPNYNFIAKPTVSVHQKIWLSVSREPHPLA